MNAMISGSTDIGLDDLSDVSGFSSVRDLNIYGLERRTVSGVYGPSGPVGENTSFYRIHKGVLSTPITVTSSLDITPLLGVLPSTSINDFISYDSVNEVFKCEENTTFFYSFLISLRISGDYAANQNSEYSFELRRADGVTVVTSSQFIRLSNSPLVNVTASVIPTRVFPGGADPFQLDGFKIFVNKISGPDFTFDAVNFQQISFDGM